MGSLEGGAKFRVFFEFHARMKVPWREAEHRCFRLYHTVGLGDTEWESSHSGFTELREKLNRRVMLLCGECCVQESPFTFNLKNKPASTKQKHYLKEKIKMKPSETYCSIQMKRVGNCKIF